MSGFLLATVQRSTMSPSPSSWLRSHLAYYVIPHVVDSSQGHESFQHPVFPECGLLLASRFNPPGRTPILYEPPPYPRNSSSTDVHLYGDPDGKYSKTFACWSSSIFALPSSLCHAPSWIITDIILFIPRRQSYVQTTFKLCCFCIHVSWRYRPFSVKVFHGYTGNKLRWDNTFDRDMYLFGSSILHHIMLNPSKVTSNTNMFIFHVP